VLTVLKMADRKILFIAGVTRKTDTTSYWQVIIDVNLGIRWEEGFPSLICALYSTCTVHYLLCAENCSSPNDIVDCVVDGMPFVL
jgi:hypothetical protein